MAGWSSFYGIVAAEPQDTGEVRLPSWLHHIAAPVRPVVMRIGRDWRLSLPCRHLGTTGERREDQKRGEPSMQVHCAEIASIRLGSLFLTLPTRGLTGQHVIFSDG